MHLKRKNMGKFWSIPKKGTKYIAVPNHNQKESIPLVTVMRDMLKFVRNTKELKKLLNERKISINHKLVRETNFPICLFDILTFSELKKNYKAVLNKNKKIVLDEIPEKEANSKIFKVINRKILAGKKIQLNLMHGRNILSKDKVNVGDSIVFDLKENKILKIIPMEKGRNAFVIKGKHAGHSGKINEIVERGGKKIAKISLEDQKLNVWIKNIVVVE